MKILRLDITKLEYEPKKWIVYENDKQIDHFNCISIGRKQNLSSLIPIRGVFKNFFDSRSNKPKVDDKYITGDRSHSIPAKAVLVKGDEITAALFIEAVDFFKKAVYTFSAQYNLSKKGYLSWAKITNYYSSFYSINALIRLQGRAISRIWKPPTGTRFHILPYDFEKGNYVICCDGVKAGGDHQIVWRFFYELYNRYNYSNRDFEVIHKIGYNNNEPNTESEFRNDINYRVCYSYEEIWDPSIIPSLVRKYIQDSSNSIPAVGIIRKLRMLSTDLDYMYFARSALRLLFTFSIIESIANSNVNVRPFWNIRKNEIIRFLLSTTGRHFKSDKSTLGKNLDHLIVHGFS